jgi:hypothetical protein
MWSWYDIFDFFREFARERFDNCWNGLTLEFPLRKAIAALQKAKLSQGDLVKDVKL